MEKITPIAHTDAILRRSLILVTAENAAQFKQPRRRKPAAKPVKSAGNIVSLADRRKETVFDRFNAFYNSITSHRSKPIRPLSSAERAEGIALLEQIASKMARYS